MSGKEAYKVGSLSQLFNNDEKAETEEKKDDLFKKKVALIEPKKIAARNSDDLKSPVEKVEVEKAESKNRRIPGSKSEESKAKTAKRNTEEEKRTIFVGNLPSSLASKKNKIKKLFLKFGSIDCVRIRSAARPDLKTPKRVAVITGNFHAERTNVNAYVRFKEVQSVEKSLEMNGFEVEGHVLRVDKVQADNNNSNNPKKSVFIGNLAFNLEEDELRRHFSSCGSIESVRLIRDSSSGVGKGFGYVTFALEDAVELALKSKKGSELSGRKIRMERCVKKVKPTIAINNNRVQKKKVTKKELGNRFQGQKVNSDNKRMKRKTKAEKRKILMSKKLLAK